MDQALRIANLFQLAQLVAYLAPVSPQRPRLTAMYCLGCSEPLQALLGPWAGAQTSMPTALCLAEDGWFAAHMAGAREESVTEFRNSHSPSRKSNTPERASIHDCL